MTNIPACAESAARGEGGAGPLHERLEVMNFLNEVADRYPRAISLAAGRPAEQFFGAQEYTQRLGEFVGHLQRSRGLGLDAAFKRLAQYGPTAGLINPLIAEQVRSDEGIPAEPSRVLVTAGCQEAMQLCVTTLCREAGDVLLVRSPSYIGITGIAQLGRVELAHFNCGEGESLPGRLGQALERLDALGKRVRALYLVPDFDNPTGGVVPQAEREAVIELCAQRRIVVLEDNPYGLFLYEGEPVPRMAALDRHGCVVYLGTYSKTLCPALRVGFAIVPPTLFGSEAAARSLLARLCQAKSFGTCNTSQMTQAIVGGVLLAEGGSLVRRIRPAVAYYRGNRDAMLEALEATFPPATGLRWNRPRGGFFMTLALPFEFGKAEAEHCAGEHGVLTMPVSFFALDREQDRRLRLSFSGCGPDEIREGIARLGRFVHGRIGSPRTALAHAAVG